MPETRSATEIKDGILDEVLLLTSAQILDRVIDGSGPVCDGCSETSFNKARTLASFTEIGRLSIADAGERLAEFNAEICGHVGATALTDVTVPEFANA